MNRLKAPPDWQPDILMSVAQYDMWYRKNAPDLYAAARERSKEYGAQLLVATGDLLRITDQVLLDWPRAVLPLRLAAAPPMARDRLITMSGANKSVVEGMERTGLMPNSPAARASAISISGFIADVLDPALFSWVKERRPPTAQERSDALLVLGDRIARSLADADLRNAQERRQKELLREHLVHHGYRESPLNPLPRGMFALGRTLVVTTEDGRPQNLPVDCLIRTPFDGPLLCLELKSAGDFVNPNKRRKEESDKKGALGRTFGDDAILLLQIFGYFDRNYLSYEGGAGIDWVWDHRLADLDRYIVT